MMDGNCNVCVTNTGTLPVAISVEWDGRSRASPSFAQSRRAARLLPGQHLVMFARSGQRIIAEAA